MSTYIDISKDEMEQFLAPQGFKRLFLDGTHELVYGKRIGDLSMRVYTGINPTGHSRDVGKDAVRVDLWWRQADGRIVRVATSKRVHRVAGWRKNLQQRIDSLTTDGRCRTCAAPLVRRKGKNGPFLGCANYPDCRQTERVAA